MNGGGEEGKRKRALTQTIKHMAIPEIIVERLVYISKPQT